MILATKLHRFAVFRYAGIEFQKVQETWSRGFSQIYMVSNRDIIVASVDGRGSAYEGDRHCKTCLNKLK